MSFNSCWGDGRSGKGFKGEKASCGQVIEYSDESHSSEKLYGLYLFTLIDFYGLSLHTKNEHTTQDEKKTKNLFPVRNFMFHQKKKTEAPSQRIHIFSLTYTWHLCLR